MHEGDHAMPFVKDMLRRLQCIVTAFELLSGQGPIFCHLRFNRVTCLTDIIGEALNIDLKDFINHLFALIPTLSTIPGIEDAAEGTRKVTKNTITVENESPSNMLFRSLELALCSRSASAKSPSWLTAAFAKRLLNAALHFPPRTAERTIRFVHNLFAAEPKLEALLSAEDRVANGIFQPDVDDPQLCNAFASHIWELDLLARTHVDGGVRTAAAELLQFSYDQQ